jgi:serine/threonine-protein kinase
MMVNSNVRLVRPLGEGGMGRVWVAEHLSLRTNVVVKFMSRDLADSPEAIARFSREAAAASQVKSPHVVQMLDHGVGETGAPYIVMELLEGKDLEQYLRVNGVLTPREVVGIVAQLARALAKAHERGIVHRDIKPSNVFLLDAGGGETFVKLLDFGIAKGSEAGGAGPGPALAATTTRTGTFIGSPYYMSPEQVVGAKDIDFRADLWSLGVVVYEALTGTKPFYADNVGALALRIHRDPLPVPTKANPALPAAIDAWFARACAREPKARFGSAKEMAETLAVALTGESIPPGLRIESPTSGRTSGRAAVPSSSPSASSTLRGAADARSETSAGAVLVTSGGTAGLGVPMTRPRWRMVLAVALAALVVGFVVPRLMKRDKGQGIEGLSSAAASADAPAAPSREGRTTPPALAAEGLPASALATAAAPVPSASALLSAPPTAHPSVSTARPQVLVVASAAATSPHSVKAHPSAASASASAPAASHAAPSATAAQGSDDDIK